MNAYRHACVIDKDGRYTTVVLIISAQHIDGELKDELQNYELADGESLVNTPRPLDFIKARWNGQAWEEAATPEEITAAEAEHVAMITGYRTLANLAPNQNN